jgi:hypothetical protein
MQRRARFPRAIDPARVGKYPVWCHPERRASDKEDGSDYYRAFASYPEALRFSKKSPGAEDPIALVLQKEYIAEPASGQYVHVKEPRITEWPVAFLERPRRTRNTIPDFLSPNAPSNRLDVLRGLAKKRG